MAVGFPGILGEIADAAGDAAAFAVARAKGGSDAYFPKAPSRKSWLVKACGAEAARKIADVLGGCTVHVPSGPNGSRAKTWASIRKMLDEGVSVAETARRLGIDSSTVRRHKRGESGAPPTDDDQPTLLLF